MPSQNRSLRISLIIDPPAVMPCALDANCPRRGIAFDIAQIMCEQLQFDCTFVPANTTIYGHAENGTWHGVVADIAAGLVDTSAPRFTPTQQRNEVIDFTASYFYEELLLVTRQSEMVSSDARLDLIHAFDWYVWLCIAMVMIIAAVIMSDTIMFKTNRSFVEVYVVKKFLPFVSFFGKYFSIWIISVAALILTRSYTGYLFTESVSSNVDRPFTDIQSLAACVKSKLCTLGVSTAMTSYVRELVEVENGSSQFTQLNAALAVNPLRSYELPELSYHILNDRSTYFTALLWDTDFYYSAVADDSCQFYILPAAILPGPNTFPVPKNWPYRSELDLLAYQFNEYGLIKELMKKHGVIEKEPCRSSVTAGGNTLFFMRDVFVFLCAGETLALVLMISEIFHDRFKVQSRI